MAIMKCPKCGGSGKSVKYDIVPNTTAIGYQEETCSSCGGKGYVTDSQVTSLITVSSLQRSKK